MSEFDFQFISSVATMVGLFFICCAVLVRRPKHILEQAFGVQPSALRELKDSVFKKNQLVLGYSCILIGTCLGIFRHSLAHPEGKSVLDALKPAQPLIALIMLVIVLCGVLNWISRLVSRWQLRRVVTEVVRERHLPFESNVSLAMEIGELLGMQLEQGDSVERYLSKLRVHLDLPPEPATTARHTRDPRMGLDAGV